jgi:hypothetical protein
MSQGRGGLDIQTAIFGGPVNILAWHVNGLWTQWNSARSGIMRQWEEVLKYVYATSTKDTANETVTDWSNTTHRPKLANLYDTLTINYDAAQFPNDKWLTWRGFDRDGASARRRKIVESYMRTKHNLRSSGFRNTMRQLQGDWVLFGNCFAEVDYVREFSTNPATGEITAGYIGPKVFRRDPRDIVFNPLAPSFASTAKITRDLYTLADLERIVNENPHKEHFKKILEIARRHRGNARQFNQGDIDKEVMLSFEGFGTPSQYFNSGLVEVLNFYGDLFFEDAMGQGEFRKDAVITVVDRWEIARDEMIDTWTGKPHIYHVGWRERPENLWAQGPLDNLVGMQYRIDHLENARADAFDQMLDPDIVFQGDVEDIMQVGGAKHYYIAENGSVDYLRPETTVLNADLQIRELTESMEMFALSPREALGFRTPGEKTLGEVQTLTNAASRSFQHKVNIYQEFLEEVVNAELEVTVRNMDGPDVIEVVDDDLGASEFKTITKADIKSNGRLVPVGARHFARNTQLVQNLQQLQMGPLADPEVAQHFSTTGLANLYQEWLDLNGQGDNLVQPYVRIDERLEAQRRMQAAQDQAMIEAQTDSAGVMTDGGAGGGFPA